MKVKDILILCCDLLEDSNTKAYLLGRTATDEETAIKDSDLMLKCYNIIADEISREYYRLSIVETFTPENGVIDYKNFTFNPVVINKVESVDGRSVEHKINPVKIYVDSTVKVDYSYACPERTLEEESDFSYTQISKRVLAIGTMVEFMLVKGMFEEAVMWRDEYRDSLRASLMAKKGRNLRSREWF